MTPLEQDSYDNSVEECLFTLVGRLEQDPDIQHMVVILADKNGSYREYICSLPDLKSTMWLAKCLQTDMLLNREDDFHTDPAS